MANVNLISARRSERIRLTRVTKALVLSSIGVFGIGFMGSLFLGGRWVGQSIEIAKVEQQLTRLRPILAEIEAAEAERGLLQPKLTTLTSAQTVTKRWFGIMDGLKRVVPERTWLTNLAVEKTAENAGTLRLNGVAPNQTRVGETMLRLSQQRSFYNHVDLRFTTSRPGGPDDVPTVEFELGAQLTQPEQPQGQGGQDATQTN
jgi:Tfp pilus assembly protein PilN